MDNDEKSSADHPASAIQYKTIRSRAITGILHAQNKGAVDWGWQSLVAYGCQTAVVVVDPKTVQVLQTLNKHRSYVVKVKWAKENYYHDISNPYYPKLASADINGNIIIWDVIYSKVSTLFSDGNNKPILDMEWLSFWSSFNDFLAVLHPPYSFTIWNTTNGNKLWKKTYTETLLSFSFDPFDPSNIAFLAQDGILFIDDFTLSKVPSSNGRKFYISNPSLSSTSSTNLVALGNTSASDEKTWSRERLRQRMRALVNAEPRQSGKSESSSQNECLGLTYHQSVRHQLLLLYAKEILVIDLELNQTVGLVSVERNGSPFTQVFCCRQRDVLYCLHENGSVSFRMRRKINSGWSLSSPLDAPSSSSPNLGHQGDSDVYLDVGYDTRCISDSMRLTKHAQLLGMACCPISETKVVLVVSDGRLVFLELSCIDKDSGRSCYVNGELNVIPNYYSNNSNSESGKNFLAAPSSSLCDFIRPTYAVAGDSQNTSGKGPMFKFIATGMLSGVAAPPLTIRMCPPLTTKNWNSYQPYLAAGTAHGTIQIFCMASGMLQKELSVHTSPIRGIEWINLHGFISFAYPNLSSNSGQVRNELVITNALTGQIKLLRVEKGEESPIEMIRVSCLKQYFVVAFKEEPFELWDLRKMCLLRTMPKKFPIITALEWSPVSSTKKKMSSLEKESSKSSADLSSTTAENASGETNPTSTVTTAQEKLPVKEQFVFTDADGQLYNFSVEGSVIKDGTKIPANGGMRNITTIAWRSEQIVMGDIDGNLTLWDLKIRVSKSVSTHRGWIKKIRFAPGRGNMKIMVLYNDGLDIWDLSRVEVISSIKCPKDMPKVMDVDWAASDTPVLATVDGCLYLMDLKLKHSMSPTYRYHLEEPVFIPHLSTSEAALNLRSFLQHQGWRSVYSLEFSEADGIRGDDLTALQQYITAIDSDIREFLPRCQFGTAQRCLLTARLFGDESELHFWMVALYYLRAQRLLELSNQKETQSEKIQDPDWKKFSPEKTKIQALSEEQLLPQQPLDCSYDVVCDAATYQARQLERINLHDSKRVTYEQTKRCAESLIMLGQTDRAVQLLLETDADSDIYQLDCLKACLVASVCSSGTAQSTIKLVATNLIANGHISEGVQLLCLIGKAVDACRYLQSYGRWNQATWLAKSTLNSTECQEVMRRWVDHLFSPVINQKHKAVLVLLSMAQFHKVLEMLLSMKCIERAAMFVNACNEFGFLEKNESNSALIEAVFLEYARYLFSLGNTPAAFYYCTMVGTMGEQLRKEMEILAEDTTTTSTSIATEESSAT